MSCRRTWAGCWPRPRCRTRWPVRWRCRPRRRPPVTTSSFGNFVAGLTVMVATAAIMYLTAGATTLRADRDLRAGLHLFTTMGLASLVLYSVSGPSGGGLVTTLGAFAVGLWFVAALGVIV